MSAAGILLIQSLEQIRDSSFRHPYRKPLDRVIKDLNKGYRLHEALAREKSWLPELDIAMITAGETSGRLDGIFNQMADYYDEQARLMRTMMLSMAYPIIVVHMAVFIFPPGMIGHVFWEGFMKGDMGIVWLFLVKKLLILAPFYGLILVMTFGGQGKRSLSFRALVDKVLFFVPLLGKGRRHLALARLSSALGALLDAGVTVIEAWDLAAMASGSPAIIRAVAASKRKLQGGSMPSEEMQHFKVYPTMFTGAYKTGEISGKLVDAMNRMYRYYQDLGTRKMQAFAEWMPRAIFMVIAIATGFYIVSFWIGYFANIGDLISNAGTTP